MKERLQKILSQAGICSRRAAEKLIADGKVSVNGKKAAIGDSADEEADEILLSGQRVCVQKKKKYIMLYKPVGFITTLSDEQGRRDVSMLVSCGVRVYPVGRLDMNSEGLLIMTNDGEVANKLMHPKNNVDKTYLVDVRGDVSRISDLSKPMEIDGYTIRPAKVEMISRQEREARVKIKIHEGKNRQIRKMCEICSLRVAALKRLSIGELHLDEQLKPGNWRDLTENEVHYLKNL